ncbi:MULTISPECIES: hypothetical protein [Enterococcus]|uniref:Uncharacterized protein n=1 Tax=Enterococcus malodoratus ATCC 43197 TaxID=1158601 RepID=R2PCA8_9ENTE|nr:MULTISPECIES: hypothetical protein [Enterococcus]BBM18857.1 hypothetical protein G15_2525 [Enterococcus avium]EOH80833.1 hypothetical protein UAI_00874 [Enterococcus malodoratus ATCC 43197]EOT69342.1 hypothetical protein I585_00805 [Enterococcus malodoratus ATCC 43197]OJG63353.1 hypothetical protein RV07_GL001097 [Enterococcus malodoratus]SPW68681.1 Uncharacterised protein [Enterococcus malodoratus]
MKKKMIAVLLLSVLATTPITALGAEKDGENLDILTGDVRERAVTLKQWFKGIPPKTYRGKQRIDYYKAIGGGYIGVYL